MGSDTLRLPPFGGALRFGTARRPEPPSAVRPVVASCQGAPTQVPGAQQHFLRHHAGGEEQQQVVQAFHREMLIGT